MQPKYYAFILAFLAANLLQMPFAQAQKVADVRGFVIDKTSGQPIPYATVQISTTPIIGGVTDMAGFFNINDVPFGKYTLSATVVGFDSLNTELAINTKIINQTFYLSPSSVQLQGVEIRGSKEAKRGDVLVSVAQVTPTQIKALASTGGEADIAQYLQVLPGVVFTGDQGGQLYIRGGSPVQNKILLDGMTLYNPFHSIGFFSTPNQKTA